MQIAVIPRDEELYCILKPMTKIKGIKDDEAFVFKVDESGEESTINLEAMNLLLWRYLRLITTYLRKIKKETQTLMRWRMKTREEYSAQYSRKRNTVNIFGSIDDIPGKNKAKEEELQCLVY